MEKLKVSIKIENRDTTIYINNEKIDEEKLQSKESSLAVSEIGKIADNKNLYLFGHKIIDEFKNNYNIIVSGRDLMKIYPELNYHFLITASLSPDDGGELHAVVGSVWLSPAHLFPMLPIQQDRAPPARPRISGTGAIGIDRHSLHVVPSCGMDFSRIV